MGRVFAVAAVVFVAVAWVAAAPARPADPVLVGSKWVGKLTQKGTFAAGGAGPPEFRTTLTVTERAGDSFAAELREDTDAIGITYVVTGEVVRSPDGKGHRIDFKSVAAKDLRQTTAILGVPYTGSVAGRAMTGTWSLRAADEPTAIDGEFRLELAR